MVIRKYDRETLIKFYREMKRVREFEEKACELFAQGMIEYNIHTCIGQEATAVGGCQALEKSDLIICTHRGHGQCLAKGGDPGIMMAELFGRETGYCRGRGGSMHIASIDVGILGANGIVGAGIPIAVGSALATNILKTTEITLAFFGDGASNTGEFHEALNMASAWNLPVVFFCENNKYAVSVDIERVIKVKDIAERAKAYGIPGVVVDGCDVLAVYETTKKAVERAREGQGPTLIEAKTYRYHGHFEGEPQVYRTEEEMSEWKKRDAIKRLYKEIIEAGFASAEDLADIDREVKEEMEEAALFAKNSPWPTENEALMYVYSNDNERSVAR